MRTLIITALAIVVAGASFTTTEAKAKKSKTAEPVTLVTSSDTLSYAAGIAFTDGLMPYLKQQYDVDSATMTDFLRGFNEVIAKGDDAAVRAYSAGMAIANQLKRQMVPTMEKEFTDTPDSVIASLVYRGFADALAQDTTIFHQQEAMTIFSAKREADKAYKEERANAANKAAGEAFLAENATKEGVVVTESGLQYKIITMGEGEVPHLTDKVVVNYEGRLIDGTVFDASSKHGKKPSTFQADKVIKGWTEALTMMSVGSKWQLFIPYNLAYGERSAGKDIKPYSALIFDVELVGINNDSNVTGKSATVSPTKKSTSTK